MIRWVRNAAGAAELLSMVLAVAGLPCNSLTVGLVLVHAVGFAIIINKFRKHSDVE